MDDTPAELTPRRIVITDRELVELITSVRQMAEDFKRMHLAVYGADGQSGLVKRVGDLEAFAGAVKKVSSWVLIPLGGILVSFIVGLLTGRVQVFFK